MTKHFFIGVLTLGLAYVILQSLLLAGQIGDPSSLSPAQLLFEIQDIGEAGTIGQALDAELQAYREVRKARDQALHDLSVGKGSLMSVTAKLFVAAQRVYPRYFRILGTGYGNAGNFERLARHLVRILQVRSELGEAPACNPNELSVLKAELNNPHFAENCRERENQLTEI